MLSSYDQVLYEVNDNGKFQKRFDIVYNFILIIFWTMTYMNLILVLVITPHTCKIPEKPYNVSDFVWKSRYIPIVTEPESEVKFSSCLLYADPGQSNDTEACDSYDFDKTWYESTVPSENKWVCENEIYVANVFAYSRIMEAIGSAIFGWLGDIYGRRPTYILGLLLIVLGRFLSVAFSSSYVMFVFGCMIASFPSWSVMQSVTVISMEISSPERRTTSATMRYVAFSLGLVIMPFLSWWLRDWKLFMVVTTVTLVPYLLFSGKMIESPRWLWVQSNKKKCMHILKIVSKTNKRIIKEDNINEILNLSFEISDHKFGPLTLFSCWTLAYNTILMLLIWIAVTISYSVLLISIGEKSDVNPFVEFAWQASVELPGNFIAAWLADHVGRRHAGIISMGLTAVTWALLSYKEHYMNPWLESWWMRVSLTVIGRIAITVSYYIINLVNMELYPTCLRQSGMALGNIMSGVASALAPYVFYIGRQIDPSLPTVILSSVSIIGMISSYLLPETLNANLPETIEDARNFRKNKMNKTINQKVNEEELRNIKN